MDKLSSDDVATFVREWLRFSTRDVMVEFAVSKEKAAAALAILSGRSKIRKIGKTKDGFSRWCSV